MKGKNSRKSVLFGLIFFIISVLIIGFAFGTEVARMIVVYTAILVTAIFLMGVSIVLIYSIREKIEENKNK